MNVSFYLLAHTRSSCILNSPPQLMLEAGMDNLFSSPHQCFPARANGKKRRFWCFLDPKLNTSVRIWCENNAGHQLKRGDLQIAKTAVREKHYCGSVQSTQRHLSHHILCSLKFDSMIISCCRLQQRLRVVQMRTLAYGYLHLNQRCFAVQYKSRCFDRKSHVPVHF